MELKKIYSLEEILDRIKFADIDVAIFYGDNILKSVAVIKKDIEDVENNFKKYEQGSKTKSILQYLNRAKSELSMITIAVKDMQSYLTGYKEKIQPSQIEDIGATEEFDFTEEEMKKLKKYRQPDFTPEEYAKLQKYHPKNYKKPEE